jgi:hypothetical protein
LLAADHEKNKVGKPFLIFCNEDLQVGDRTKPVTIYNGVWHSTRLSREDHNLLGPEQLSIHDYDIPPEGTLVQTTGTQVNDPVDSDLGVENTPTNPEPEKQDNSDSEQDQPDPLNQQICHSPIEPMQLLLCPRLYLCSTHLSFSLSFCVCVPPACFTATTGLLRPLPLSRYLAVMS